MKSISPAWNLTNQYKPLFHLFYFIFYEMLRKVTCTDLHTEACCALEDVLLDVLCFPCEIILNIIAYADAIDPICWAPPVETKTADVNLPYMIETTNYTIHGDWVDLTTGEKMIGWSTPIISASAIGSVEYTEWAQDLRQFAYFEVAVDK
jgi:hypothetical protein